MGYAVVSDPVSPSTPSHFVPEVSPWRAVQLLEDIERLPADATGALVFGQIARPEGTILIEAGRVCWATAARMRRRLTDLLRFQADPPLGPDALETVYRRCRAEGQPLGESLVELGLVTREGLRRALQQHSAEAIALLALERRTPPWTWVEHRHRRYDATFTFSPAELLSGTGALRQPKAAERAAAELQKNLEGGGFGAAFIREPAHARAFLIAAFECDALGVHAVLALGEWVAGALDLSGAFDPGARMVITSRRDGGAILGWRLGDIDFVAQCSDPSSVAYVVATQARLRRERTES